MISRKTTLCLADTLCLLYPVDYDSYLWPKQDFYEFLFADNFPTWFLQQVKALTSVGSELRELILDLHTGEAISPEIIQSAKRLQLGQSVPSAGDILGLVIKGATIPTEEQLMWEKRRHVGQAVLQRLTEGVLLFSETDIPDYKRQNVVNLQSALLARLELDGFSFINGKLHRAEEDVVDTEEETGILTTLVRGAGLDNQNVIDHHLALSEKHYMECNWDDCIGNSRKYLEEVLKEVAILHCRKTQNRELGKGVYSSPKETREYLERYGLIIEKELKTISEVYGLLSETGNHPYIAQKDQARLMRHLALTFAQFILLRLQGALKTLTTVGS